jgi:hypothetical protein
MSKHTPKPCGAVFCVGANAPASCALRFNHLGPHRAWTQIADDRDELLEALRAFVRDLERGPWSDGPPVTHPAHDRYQTARAAIAKAECKP